MELKESSLLIEGGYGLQGFFQETTFIRIQDISIAKTKKITSAHLHLSYPFFSKSLQC